MSIITMYANTTAAFKAQLLSITEPEGLVSFSYGFFTVPVAVMHQGKMYRGKGEEVKACVVLSDNELEFVEIDDLKHSIEVDSDELRKFAGELCKRIKSHKTERPMYGRTEKSDQTRKTAETRDGERPKKAKAKDSKATGYNAAPKEVQAKQKTMLNRMAQPMKVEDRLKAMKVKEAPTTTSAGGADPNWTTSSKSSESSSSSTASMPTPKVKEEKKEPPKATPAQTPPKPVKAASSANLQRKTADWDDFDS